MNKFNILLVDDVKENIHALELIIQDSFDVNIFTALKAEDGIAILMKNDIDLILSDIQMPDIDGFEFAKYLKGIDKMKDIPIVFITGIYDKKEYQKKGYNLGAIDYISKPIDDKILTSKLKVYIELYEANKLSKEKITQKDDMLIHQARMATMGEMIGVISHQLKQPLNILSLYCSDVKDSYQHNEIDDNFIDKFHHNTQEQISFLTQTINSFTDFFNPNKIKSIFTIKEAFEKIAHLLDKQIGNNNIVIKNKIGIESIYGTQSEFEQILLNLITNSKDAFIDREIKDRQITISTLTKDNYTIFIFEDNAGGIPEQNIEKIFDPYFTTKSYGTGTGLYMVKLVVQNSFEGKLKIQNTANGVKFIIIFQTKEHK